MNTSSTAEITHPQGFCKLRLDSFEISVVLLNMLDPTSNPKIQRIWTGNEGMKKKMETEGIMRIIQGLSRDYSVCIGIMEKKMETTTMVDAES